MDPRKKLLMRTGRVIAITYLLFVFISGNILALPILSSESGFDTPISGPSSGNLQHKEDDYIEIHSANVKIQDFVAEATFYNPYSTAKGT
ncbi:MAG: hypothetical protein HXS44_16295 [Theionarchaea archaeon]|nr:hypothetical protein [Theionarchaea archaeon]